MKVNPVPPGYPTISPYLFVRGAAQAIEFYKKAFGATERVRFAGPCGSVMHAEIQIGDSVVMLADENPQHHALSPAHYKGSPVTLSMYVPDCDAVYKQAVAAGAQATVPLQDQFYGDRSGMVTDPFGHTWHIASHIEDVSPQEMDRRMQELMKKQPPQGGGQKH